MKIERATCLCGDVVVSIKGVPIKSRYCHCHQCQKTMGSPSFARALFDQKNVDILGSVKSFPSSEQLNRLFCVKCGTSIAARRVDGSYIGVALVLFDNKNAFPPSEHTWVCEKVEWDELSNKTVKHQQGVIT